MELRDIQTEYDRFIQPGMATTTPDELAYIQSLIQRHRPKRFLEIGTASGLSTGFIARFLEENGGAALTSIDAEADFVGDLRHKVGFLAAQIYPGTGLDLRIVPDRTALDLDDLGGPWDMAFVDANHCHPWPTLDTLAVWPHLQGARLVIHHDLKLFRRYRRFRGSGPKLLHDQMPPRLRDVAQANHGNIFSLNLDVDRSTLEAIASDALSLPWSVRPALEPGHVRRIHAMLGRHYSPDLRAVFDECEDINTPAAYRYLQPYYRGRNWLGRRYRKLQSAMRPR